MLKVENVSRSFGSRAILKNVSFEIPQPTLTGVIGPGGSGKSTLLKVIAGIHAPETGAIVVETPRSSEASHQVVCQSLMFQGLMFQEGALFDSLTVYENVAFPLSGGKTPSTCLPIAQQEKINVSVSEMLARVGLTKAASKFPAQLSGGMRKRVSLARALVARPAFVMLDDPTAGLDPIASSVIMNLIVELYREYTPNTIVVSHDLRRLLPVVDKILAIFDGQVKFHGTLEDLKVSECETLRRFVSCRYELH